MIFLKFIRITLALVTCWMFFLSAQNHILTEELKQTILEPSFVEAHEDFPREEKNLRKWDAPVIADLDQDGYLDLLLNDHGFSVSVCWNNKGRFAKPYDLIMGDMHGISVGDFDQDGNLEIVISRGGGSGSNARNSKILRVDRQRNFTDVPDFNPPLELMRGRTVKFYDGDNDGDLDLLNFAFPDREKKGKSENYIYENDGKGQLVLASLLPPVKSDGQKTLISDFNGDAIVDLLLYGHGSAKAYQGQGDLNYTDMTDAVFPFIIENVTGIVEFDYDNDGDFDLFFTRGKGFEIGETFFDKERKVWGFFTSRGEFKFEDLETGDVLNIENFQSQWPYNDAYYIGESAYIYEFPGETHSGKDIRLVNSNALGFPDKFNEDGGFYIGYIGNRKWRIAGNIWSPATGVIHGVTAYPDYNHPKGLSDILLENKNGKFVDVTEKKKLYREAHTSGVAVADLDNNGLQDLLIVRRGDLIHENEALIYLNQGETGFKQLKYHQIISTELGAIGLGLETFDYNHDGKVDVVIGNERGKWHLFKNTMSAAENANFIVVEVGYSASGKATALGALVEVSSCNTKQIKRVGSSGAAYSRSFNHFVHFGLGTYEGPVKVTVTWTNGEALTQNVASLNNRVFLGAPN